MSIEPSQIARRRIVRAGAALVLVLPWAAPLRAQSASFSERELKILSRAASYVLPPPSAGALVAIAFVPGDAASRQDAEAIATAMGDGLRVGPLVLRARPADLNAIAAGGFSIVIAAAGAAGPRLAQAAHMARALCVTRDIEAVRAGTCTMAITTEPRVEITVNHAAAAAAGIDFAAAFRMMIKEI